MTAGNDRAWAWRALSSLACLCLATFATPAFACGVSGPDGVWSCSLEEHDEELRPRWHVGAAYVYTSTALRFSHDVRAEQTRNAVVATAAYAPSPRLTWTFSAGAAFAGELRLPDGNYALSVGPSGAAGVAYRILEGQPFVVLTGLLSASTASSQRQGQPADTARYSAFDLRLGAVVGATLWDQLSPYALARVFGGPVFWHYHGEAVTGTDVYHYQLGAGVSWLIANRCDLFFEGVPLGERALSGGASVSF
jgi:hypothetical protein